MEEYAAEKGRQFFSKWTRDDVRWMAESLRNIGCLDCRKPQKYHLRFS